MHPFWDGHCMICTPMDAIKDDPALWDIFARWAEIVCWRYRKSRGHDAIERDAFPDNFQADGEMK